MSESAAEPPAGTRSITGRTAADAVVDLYPLLGRAAPFFMLLGMGLFGFYEYVALDKRKTEEVETARNVSTTLIQPGW